MSPTHAELLERHRAVIPNWVALYYHEPIELVRGEGRHVWDGEGNRYLDFFGGILTTMTGYSVPEVVEAIQEQAARMLHTSTLYLIRPMVELAERISALLPIPDTKVFFTNSGTEAIDAALLLATNYRRSNQILALRYSYHGRSFSAMAVTGNRGWSASALSPFTVHYVHNGYRLRSPFGPLSDAELIEACVGDLRNVLDVAASGDVACLIAEPIQGVGGFIDLPDGLLGAMGKVLDEQGILLIADEVQTGWGRTGDHFWGFEAHGVVPDLVTFAKGLGNGLAIGGVAGRAEVMDAVHAASISTFGGNPLAASGALANLEYLLSHDLQHNAARIGGDLCRGLGELADRIPAVGEVRGKGLMIGVEFVQPSTGDPDAALTNAVLEECRRGGLLVGKGGLYGNVIRIAPPLSVTAEEAEEGLGIFISAVEAATG